MQVLLQSWPKLEGGSRREGHCLFRLDSAKHLRLLLEQDKAEECLKGFIIFLRAWQGQTLNY